MQTLILQVTKTTGWREKVLQLTSAFGTLIETSRAEKWLNIALKLEVA